MFLNTNVALNFLSFEPYEMPQYGVFQDGFKMKRGVLISGGRSGKGLLSKNAIKLTIKTEGATVQSSLSGLCIRKQIKKNKNFNYSTIYLFL